MQIHSKIVTAILGIALVLSLSPAYAGDSNGPVIPKATKSAGKDKCVLPVAEMRRNHMNHILHQRDATVHEGIRTKQFSLTECVNCHVPAKPKGQEIRVTSSEHFCNSCHTYTAVSIDCFQCHSDQPTTNPYSAKKNDLTTHKYVNNSVKTESTSNTGIR